jgi:hypothetical protein
MQIKSYEPLPPELKHVISQAYDAGIMLIFEGDSKSTRNHGKKLVKEIESLWPEWFNEPVWEENEPMNEDKCIHGIQGNCSYCYAEKKISRETEIAVLKEKILELERLTRMQEGYFTEMVARGNRIEELESIMKSLEK